MTLDDLGLARVLHVVGIVVWIGGVAFVTMVLLPAVRDMADVEQARTFETLERRFAWIARLSTLIVGASGFYMVWKFDLWDRFNSLAYWWMHAMVAVWAIFTFVLFIAEPLFVHRWFARRARENPGAAFALAQRLHWLLLAVSAVTVAGAVAGAHGYALFG